MPRIKGIGKGKAKPVTIRLPDEEDAYYRRKANEAGLSLNAFLCNLLVQGVVAGKVEDFSEAMDAKISAISSLGRGESDGLSEPMTLSLLTCEAILSEILAMQDVKVLYKAQELARSRMKKLKGD